MTLINNHLPIRLFSPEQDIPRLLSLYAAVEAADQDGTEFTEQTLRAQQNLPGHNPALDRWVIDAPDDSTSLISLSSDHSSPWIAGGRCQYYCPSQSA